MLQIKHLTKVYKTKGGAETKALDDVSIEFREKGLVFLLGKSGSGKSTLLNLAGGLDEPTSGEVVVMGKSSKDFSGSDFDSYRNTFVGFIFQEYNILNEFSVEDNIALALELQGKKKDKEKIHSILKDVELEEFAKRKPNTLSGGQKQRIAIARALIKDPQIIMADEPTGALDSATGKQVFDTLKHLSETRLVIVVSHDREFAEVYGDRIVELKDGKIISDVTKTKDAPVERTAALVEHGSDIITIRHGVPLDSATLQAVQKFISESEGDVILTKGQKNLDNFRRVNRIDESGATEHFAETPPQELPERDGKQVKFIRSRLPVGKAIRIGASGLKLKPLRLLMTIFLSFVAFVMFGLFSTMMFYDGKAVLEESLLASDDNYISVRKQYTVHSENTQLGYTYDSNQPANFTPANVRSFGADAFGCWSVNGNAGNLSVDSRYFSNSVTRLAVLPASHPIRTALGNKYPTGENEIAVSSYFWESAKNGKFYTLEEDGRYGDPVSIASENDLIGKQIVYSGEMLTITGIFNSGNIPSSYEAIKENNSNFLTEMMFEMYMDGSIHRLGFVSDAFAEAHKELLDRGSYSYVNYFDSCSSYYEIRLDGISQNGVSSVKVYDPNGELQLPVIAPASFTALKDDEFIVSPYLWNDCVWTKINAERDAILAEEPDSQDPQVHEDWAKKLNAFDTKTNLYSSAWNLLVQRQIYSDEDGIFRAPTEQESAEAKATVLACMKEYPITIELWKEGNTMIGEYTVVGFYLPPANGNYSADGFYCTQSFYDSADVHTDDQETTNYKPEPDAMYDTVLVPHQKTREFVQGLLAKIDVRDPATDVSYTLNSSVYTSVQSANSLVETLSTAFLWVGIAMALFSSLLLFNFISMSISNKRKEIGILRAVGARGTDVFKIFFSESGIIVGICALLSIVGTVILSKVINDIIMNDAGLSVALFVFGLPSLGIMLGVALVVAFISTFLPVFFAARKKPVESIRAL